MRSKRRPDGSFEDRRAALYGATVEERYEHKVDRSGGPDACHPWTGGTDKGYARFWAGDRTAGGKAKMIRAHNWAYKRFVGPLADGEVVRHLCHNKVCQNRTHWAKGTPKDNYDDEIRAGKKNPAQKLSNEQVSAVRSVYKAGGVTQKDLAKLYGVTVWTMNGILTGRLRKL